jgi:hypothetical protein
LEVSSYIPWGCEAAAVVLIAGNTLLVIEQPTRVSFQVRTLAGEPRDDLALVEAGGARRRCPMRSASH